MGYFDCTLFLFKSKKEPQSFLHKFHNQLNSLNMEPELEEGSLIVFNDLRNGAEKDYLEITQSISSDELLELLCSWKGLGLLSFTVLLLSSSCAAPLRRCCQQCIKAPTHTHKAAASPCSLRSPLSRRSPLSLPSLLFYLT